MSTFVPLVDGAQVEIGYSLGGKNVENRLWFTTDSPPVTSTNLQGLSDGVAGWHTANVLPFLSSDIEALSVIATKWDDHVGDTFAQTGIHLFGGTASPSHSANVSLVVPFRWPTATARRKRNKNYIPGIPKSEVDLNTPSAALISALFEAYAALIDAARLFAPLLTWRWRVTSMFEGGSARSTQFVRDSIGPPPDTPFVLGQRRKRLTD